MLAARDQRPTGLDRLLDDVAHVDRRELQHDLALIDSIDVEQVVDEPDQVRRLATDHLDGVGRMPLLAEVRAAQDLDGRADRSERIAELVREDRKELVLVAIRRAQLILGSAPLGDVRHRDHAAPRVAVGVAHGPGAEQHGGRRRVTARKQVLGAVQRHAVHHCVEIGCAALSPELKSLAEAQQHRVAPAQLERGTARSNHARVGVANHDGVHSLLEDRPLERLRGDDRFVGLLPREVGYDQADAAFLRQQRHRYQHGHAAAVFLEEAELALRCRAGVRREQRRDQRAVARRDELGEHPPYQCLDRVAEHVGERLIGIENVAAVGQRHGTLLHPLDHQAIRAMRASERLHFVRRAVVDDERVDLAAPDRAQRLLGLVEPQPRREVRDQQRDAVLIRSRQGREERAERAAVRTFYRHVGLRTRAAAAVAERVEQRSTRLFHQVGEPHADDVTGHEPDHRGEARVRVQHVAIGRDGHRAVVHVLDERAIAAARGTEQQHLRVVLVLRDDDRVDLAAFDRVHRGGGLVLGAVVHARHDQAHAMAFEQRDRRDPHAQLHAGGAREAQHGKRARGTVAEHRGEQRMIGRAHDLDDLPAE